MFRIIRVPPALDQFFRPLKGHFHWDHGTYFRLLVLALAVMWGRWKVANLYRYLEAEHHRTRFNNFFLVERWDPEAALGQKALELLRALRPAKGETIYLLIDDSKKAKRGKAMDAVAKMQEPTSDSVAILKWLLANMVPENFFEISLKDPSGNGYPLA